MKQLYKITYVEDLNGRILYTRNSMLRYEETEYKDRQVLFSTEVTDYAEFKELVKARQCKTTDFKVVKKFGRDILKRKYWLKYPKKYFNKYRAIKRVTYYDTYSLDRLRSELTAEQYIDWCKDHAIIDSSLLKAITL